MSAAAVVTPRRLLVSTDGVAHDPTCRRVPMTAEMRGWGELLHVEDALTQLDSGVLLESFRRGLMPGPDATSLCSTCTPRLF